MTNMMRFLEGVAAQSESERIVAIDQMAVRLIDIGPVQIGDSDCPSTFLPRRALEGPTVILERFQLPLDERRRVQGANQAFIQMPKSELELSVHVSADRFWWRSAQASWPDCARLAEIALRLEPAICSEGLSERTIGQQRRFMAPLRMRTKLDFVARAQANGRRDP
jgi:hypothetical protein